MYMFLFRDKGAQIATLQNLIWRQKNMCPYQKEMYTKRRRSFKTSRYMTWMLLMPDLRFVVIGQSTVSVYFCLIFEADNTKEFISMSSAIC